MYYLIPAQFRLPKKRNRFEPNCNASDSISSKAVELNTLKDIENVFEFIEFDIQRDIETERYTTPGQIRRPKRHDVHSFARATNGSLT